MESLKCHCTADYVLVVLYESLCDLVHVFRIILVFLNQPYRVLHGCLYIREDFLNVTYCGVKHIRGVLLRVVSDDPAGIVTDDMHGKYKENCGD